MITLLQTSKSFFTLNMRRSRITITLDNFTLSKVDRLIDKNTIRNRSHAIEYILNLFTQSKAKKAVILAGGQGVNLRPYTLEVPKPLLPVQGRPILEHLIEQLKVNGIEEVIICIGYLGEKIKEHFGDGERYGIKITYSEEKESLGTGGALAKVQKYVDQETFLVIHADILTNFSFYDLVDFHQKEGALATVALTTVNQPTQFGQLTLHGAKLVKFYQKDEDRDVKSHLIHCGIYVFEPSIFKHFPKTKGPFSLEDIIEQLVKEQHAHGFVFGGQWFDVGTTENYERAIKEYKGIKS